MNTPTLKSLGLLAMGLVLGLSGSQASAGAHRAKSSHPRVARVQAKLKAHPSVASLIHPFSAGSNSTAVAKSLPRRNLRGGSTAAAFTAGGLIDYSVANYDRTCYFNLSGQEFYNGYFDDSAAYVFSDAQIKKLCELPANNMWPSGATGAGEWKMKNALGPSNCAWALFQYTIEYDDEPGVLYDFVNPLAYVDIFGRPRDVFTESYPLSLADVVFACTGAPDITDDDTVNDQRAYCILDVLMQGYTYEEAANTCVLDTQGLTPGENMVFWQYGSNSSTAVTASALTGLTVAAGLAAVF